MQKYYMGPNSIFKNVIPTISRDENNNKAREKRLKISTVKLIENNTFTTRHGVL